ncbi:hypothetical protein ACJX0J_013122, partial [Zea mays]
MDLLICIENYDILHFCNLVVSMPSKGIDRKCASIHGNLSYGMNLHILSFILVARLFMDYALIIRDGVLFCAHNLFYLYKILDYLFLYKILDYLFLLEGISGIGS